MVAKAQNEHKIWSWLAQLVGSEGVIGRSNQLQEFTPTRRTDHRFLLHGQDPDLFFSYIFS